MRQTADLFHLNHIESIIASRYEVRRAVRSLLTLFYCFYDDDDNDDGEHISSGRSRVANVLSMVLNCKQMAQAELVQL